MDRRISMQIIVSAESLVIRRDLDSPAFFVATER
jgi:hypothetical protein